MDKVSIFVIGALCLVFVRAGNATDPISAGTISQIVLRGDYVMFKLITDSGENVCAPCPADPGNVATGGYCWIEEADKSKLAALFLARAQDALVWGRVNDLATSCKVHQMALGG